MSPANERKEMAIFKDQLNFLNSEYQTIIFTEHSSFFYNISKRKIRPFNSVIWFSIDKFHLDDFVDYLNRWIETIYSDFIDNPTRDISPNGYFFDGKAIINLSNYDIDYINEDLSSPKLNDELHDFIFYLEKVYKNYEKFLDESINSTIDLL